MAYQRRDFLKTTAGLTIGGLVSGIAEFSPLAAGANKRERIAVLWQDECSKDAEIPVLRTDLQRALSGFDVTFISAVDASPQITTDRYDLLVMPFGSHFPSDVYPSLLRFLKQGGNLLSLGGTPFGIPWIRGKERYTRGMRQVNFHKDLGITQSFRTELPKNYTLLRNSAALKQEEFPSSLRCSMVHELYLRFSDTNDFPNESGTAGAQDALLTPLVWITDAAGEKRGAPVVQLDHLRGTFFGGRWVIAAFEGTITSKGIETLARQALLGTMHLSVMPGYASYFKGEVPNIFVQFRYPGGDASSIMRNNCSITVLDHRKKKIASHTGKFTGAGESISLAAAMDPKRSSELTPGFYRVQVTTEVRPDDAPAFSMEAESGFWIYDEALMSSGKVLTTDGDYFLADGAPFPVAGTTYMSGTVHRKFLFQPDPSVWYNDFAHMKRSGITMVRTGIWNAWRNYMLDPGHMNEQAMRSLDAFMMTARTFDMPVIFTFFAFLPELWNGQNAYLDPRSLSAQKEFIAHIVRRYSSMNDVMWDLINEPSFCSPQNLWSCRPNYDQFEQQAWKEFLEKKYPAENESAREGSLRQQYRLTPNESLGLPAMTDFTGTTILYDKRPLKTIDYKLFAQEMFRQWTRTMAETIRSNSNPKQMITVGQDEAGTGDSPSPHFFAEHVDFTGIHNWWLNDDLVWDGIMTKVHGKANLVEETGVMFYEKADGSAWRTEEEAAKLLDRKIAVSLATGGAGFIEWIWNINPLMKNDNEATIGLIRADGTVKPEFDIVTKYTSFLNEHKERFTGKQPEETVLFIPHSQIFSPRNSATEATKKAVRALTYELGIPLRSVSEYGNASALAGATLIIVPAPRTLSNRGWTMLYDAAAKGATVMISGIIDEDEFYGPQNRSSLFNVQVSSSGIVQDEQLYLEQKPVRFTFRGEKVQQTAKAVIAGRTRQEVLIAAVGAGTILWSPVPVENSDSEENLPAYYSLGIKKASITPIFTLKNKHSGILVLPLVLKDSVLYTFVSETNEDVTVQLTHGMTPVLHSINVPAQKAVMMFVDRKSGKMLGRTKEA